MAWLCLILAGLLEIGWPIGLKMADNPDTRISGIVIAIIFMLGSGVLLHNVLSRWGPLMVYGQALVQREPLLSVYCSIKIRSPFGGLLVHY